ncbi:out at first protein-like [Lineus longissimus]|uniref:out at first protein-like n=1 Tax=Lineus longissimus TaxID=88925 RepID=UPI002B4CC109
MARLVLSLLVLLQIWLISESQLVVNVKNGGGEIVHETINANTTEDTIKLEFKKADGTIVTQLIDFKSEFQIFKVMVLGEEERGQTQPQVLCFVTRFIKNEFISSDAMSKLRQKNPSAVRQPEDNKGSETHFQDMPLDVDTGARHITPHLQTSCHDARDATYTKEADLRVVARQTGRSATPMLGARKYIPAKQSRCKDIANLWLPCTCQTQVCIGWYPCGLKYCRGKDQAGKPFSYRCGIKTCRKCRLFEYAVKFKHYCLWDN